MTYNLPFQPCHSIRLQIVINWLEFFHPYLLKELLLLQELIELDGSLELTLVEVLINLLKNSEGELS